jgi:hypothetical protein
MPATGHLPRPFPALGLLALGALLLCGCGEGERGPFPIEEGRTRDHADRPVPPGADTFERFGIQPFVEYVAPEGWQRLPQSAMRAASLRIPGTGDDQGDVSVSRFRGDLLENLNRWRRQLGLEPVGVRELAEMPRTTVFGRPAVRVELEGTFAGMGSHEPRPGYALLGVIEEEDGARWFVKLVGPKAMVDAHRARFDRFRASLRETDLESPEPAPPMRGLDPERIAWDLPPGWRSVKPAIHSQFRVTTFRIDGGSPTLEGVLSLMAGDGGGIEFNVQRWRGQMGAQALSAAEIEALPKVEAFGAEAVWVEVPGRYRGMSGEDVPDALFLGVICLLEHDAVFVRLIGPRAEVEARREEFKALCRSMRVKA